jgi:hypothetical protein
MEVVLASYTRVNFNQATRRHMRKTVIFIVIAVRTSHSPASAYFSIRWNLSAIVRVTWVEESFIRTRLGYLPCDRPSRLSRHSPSCTVVEEEAEETGFVYTRGRLELCLALLEFCVIQGPAEKPDDF